MNPCLREGTYTLPLPPLIQLRYPAVFRSVIFYITLMFLAQLIAVVLAATAVRIYLEEPEDTER